MRRLLPVAASLLTACTATPTISGPGGARDYSDQALFDEAPSLPRLPLAVCVIDAPSTGFRGKVHSSLLDAYRQRFADALVTLDGQRGKLCDLEARYTSVMNATNGSLHSAYDGAKLADAKGHFRLIPVMYAKKLLDDREAYESLSRQRLAAGKAPLPAAGATTSPAPAPLPVPSGVSLFGRVAQPAAPAPAPPPPPAQGLSSEDIARIAAAVKGDAPAAPPAAPAAPRLPPVSKPALFASERPDDLAVIVGVESYSDIATKAPYAERDAEAFKAHVRALGVPERNIVLLTGAKASRSALAKNVEGWLPRMSKPGSRVYFYFSGHGAPDPRNGTSYLVPWDGDPNFLDSTGYPVNELYKRLGELPAAQVLVALDSCFSGAGGRSVLPTGARPLVSRLAPVAVPPKLTVLTASASNEISGSLDEKGHGAFTWFLLEGLNAGKRSAKELHAYLLPRVQDESRRLNRDQTPQLLGADAVLR